MMRLSRGISVKASLTNNQKRLRTRRVVVIAAVAACMGSKISFSNAAVSWTNNAATTAWYTNTNWAPNTASNQWLTTDVAQFNNTGSATTAGINMSTAQLSIGAIEVSSARTRNLTVGNSSTTVGALTLNGATVNSVSNTILRNASNNLFTLQNNETGSGKTMNIALANTTDNVIQIDGSGGITISSVISGSSKHMTLQGGGTGTLTLSGANTYDGGVSINAVTLVVANSSTGSPGSLTNGPAGTGAITLNGGVLSSSGNRNVGNAISLAFSGNNTINTPTNNQTFTLAGVISGGASNTLYKTGFATGQTSLILTGNNTYTGQTIIEASSSNGKNNIQIQNANSLGTTDGNTEVRASSSNAGGRLEIVGNFVTNEQIAIGGVTTSDPTNARIVGDSASTPSVGSAGANGIAGDITTLLGDGGVNYNIRAEGAAGFTVSGNVRETSGNTGTLVLGNTAATDVGVVSGIIKEDSGGSTWNVNKQSAGTWKLSGSNTYVGNTTIDAGSLEIANNTALGAAGNNSAGYTRIGPTTGGEASISYLAISGGINSPENIYMGVPRSTNSAGTQGTGQTIINLGGSNELSGTLATGLPDGTGTLDGTNQHFTVQSQGGGNLKISGNIRQDLPGTASLTLRGVSTGEVSGSIIEPTSNFSTGASLSGNVWNLIKEGSGTWTLSGNNSYTGTTTINNGRLLINGTNSGTGAVTVNANGILGGHGSIGGSVTVQSTAAVSPGNSTGALTVNGNLILAAGSGMGWELGALSTSNPGTDFDQIIANSDLTLDSGATLALDFNLLSAGLQPNSGDTFWNSNHSWKIIDVAGSNTGNSTFGTITGAPGGSQGSFNTSVDSGDIFLNWVANSVVTYTPGDANHDGHVNSLDFTELATNFNATGATAWSNTGGPTTADFNGDGTVNALDFNLLAINWGSGGLAPLPGAALGVVVPEPASIALLGIAAGLLGRRRRR